MIAFLWTLTLLSIIATMLIGLYGIARRPSLVKKLIALTIFGDAVNLFVVALGYRLIYPVEPPILPEWEKGALSNFIAHSVDPLPQALVITAVVIGMAVNVLIAFAIIQMYRIYGSTDVRNLRRKLPEILREGL
ncbi:sodium:proton antiporter [Pyrococcus kukulkanii]|uniref:NADH-ubiquinone oxidoreductase subunit 4L n=1 Tax=Pyrococcus kukulkanii TaxID=1609559 RepID=A0A127BBQ1_9EURY|nr:sodium:proton antiporter [Pyrococcus kukulkanii]AMM54752.1 NADH-ubiquinone oxidoreductase subunit 4L [Pyrococcus kukulkanii]